MYFRLSRIAFWLAAAALAWAVVAPGGRRPIAIGLAIGAGVAMLVLRRLAGRALLVESVPAEALVQPLDQDGLRDAPGALTRAIDAAPSFEAALHAAARVLRNELGALEFFVYEVHVVDAAEASIAELVEARPGFRSLPRRVRLDSAPLGQALRSRRETRVAPVIAVPVEVDGQVVAAIELLGVELPVDPRALAELLQLARQALARRGATGAPMRHKSTG